MGLVSARLLRVASDERLVALVRQGSQPAFEVLYDRHHRGILAFCRHMLASPDEAEDAVQHTFMAAYRHLVGSETDIHLRAWLYTIARNRCLSVLRARRERPVDEVDDIPTEGLAAEVQRRHDLRAMLRDLAELPEEQRAALVLSEIGDLPHDEIAAVVGCRREKVKALVFQARSSLQASREARETDCTEVRALLSTLRGGALRRTTLRRHLKDCEGCRAFRGEVERQRRAMALALPVVPTAGLKGHVLGSLFCGSGAGAGAAGVAATAAGVGGSAGAVASSGGTVLVAKALVVAVAVGGGAVGVRSVATSGSAARDAGATGAAGHSTPARTSGTSAPGSAGSGTAPAGSSGSGGSGSGSAAAAVSGTGGDRSSGKGASEDASGHTDRGPSFAATRGSGKHRGLQGTQPGKTREHPASNGKAIGTSRAKVRPAPAPRAKPVRTPKPVRTARPEKTARPQATPKPERTAPPAATPKPVKTAAPKHTPAASPAAPQTSSETGDDGATGGSGHGKNPGG